MNKFFTALFCAMAIPCLCFGVTETGSSEINTPEKKPEPLPSKPEPLLSKSVFEKYVADKLSIGLRISIPTLTDNEKKFDSTRNNNFVGALNLLEEKEDYYVSPELEYRFCDYVSVVFSLLESEGQAYNEYIPEEGTKGDTDGCVKISGPKIGIKLCYPLFEKRFTPYIGVGYALFSSDFEYNPAWWHYGWSSKDVWEKNGSQSSIRGHYRTMRVDDKNAMTYSIGAKIKVIDHLDIELFYEYFDLDLDAEFGYQTEDFAGWEHKAYGHFTMDTEFYGMAVHYIF